MWARICGDVLWLFKRTDDISPASMVTIDWERCRDVSVTIAPRCVEVVDSRGKGKYFVVQEEDAFYDLSVQLNAFSEVSKLVSTGSWLWKENRSGKWQRRWFERRGDHLLYWHSKPSKAAVEPSGVVRLKDCTCTLLHGHERIGAFVVVPADGAEQKLKLQADTMEAASQWVMELSSLEAPIDSSTGKMSATLQSRMDYAEVEGVDLLRRTHSAMEVARTVVPSEPIEVNDDDVLKEIEKEDQARDRQNNQYESRSSRRSRRWNDRWSDEEDDRWNERRERVRRTRSQRPKSRQVYEDEDERGFGRERGSRGREREYDRRDRRRDTGRGRGRGRDSDEEDDVPQRRVRNRGERPNSSMQGAEGRRRRGLDRDDEDSADDLTRRPIVGSRQGAGSIEGRKSRGRQELRLDDLSDSGQDEPDMPPPPPHSDEEMPPPPAEASDEDEEPDFFGTRTNSQLQRTATAPVGAMKRAHAVAPPPNRAQSFRNPARRGDDVDGDMPPPPPDSEEEDGGRSPFNRRAVPNHSSKVRVEDVSNELSHMMMGREEEDMPPPPPAEEEEDRRPALVQRRSGTYAKTEFEKKLVNQRGALRHSSYDDQY